MRPVLPEALPLVGLIVEHMIGVRMKNPLESVAGSIISGLLLTLALVFFLKNFIVAGG
jgi:hypothetical protein